MGLHDVLLGAHGEHLAGLAAVQLRAVLAEVELPDLRAEGRIAHPEVPPREVAFFVFRRMFLRAFRWFPEICIAGLRDDWGCGRSAHMKKNRV